MCLTLLAFTGFPRHLENLDKYGMECHGILLLEKSHGMSLYDLNRAILGVILAGNSKGI
jgi:hypothetical protein